MSGWAGIRHRPADDAARIDRIAAAEKIKAAAEAVQANEIVAFAISYRHRFGESEIGGEVDGAAVGFVAPGRNPSPPSRCGSTQ